MNRFNVNSTVPCTNHGANSWDLHPVFNRLHLLKAKRFRPWQVCPHSVSARFLQVEEHSA